MILGINAVRARSGGAKAHLVGILSNLSYNLDFFKQIHIWSYEDLLDKIPESKVLTKHNPFKTKKNLIQELFWEKFLFPYFLKKNKCEILLNVDAGSVAKFRSSVTMSRDMLSYEPGEMDRYPMGFDKLRLQLIKYVQNRSFRNSSGVIFLTRYASSEIQKSCGKLENFTHIPHGINNIFRINKKNNILTKTKKINCLYISNLTPYKHQWHVVRAIKLLNDRGYNLNLTLTGGGNAGGFKIAEKFLNDELLHSDPERKFVKILGFVNYSDLPDLYKETDIIIFASSCENMPNTLVEGMATGIPIACSNRGPMPEVLRNGGVYFDPELPEEICKALEEIINNTEIQKKISENSLNLSKKYSWHRCAKETFNYLEKIYKINS